MYFPNPKEIKWSLSEMDGTLDELLDRYKADRFERIDVELLRRKGATDEQIWEFLLSN